MILNGEKYLGTVKSVVRLLLGVMFITAAILKLLSIDYFEIYIYSFKIFSFAMTTVVSRLIIASEILLGLGLIFKVFYKKIWWLSMLMMIGFSLFLIYVIIFRNDENCHCFGELVQLNPSESIYKNIISIILLLFIRTETEHEYKPVLKNWIIASSVVVSVILPFVVFPMDTLYNKFVSKDNNINTIAFEKSLKDSINIVRLNVVSENDTIIIQRDSITKFNIKDDKYIINYISAGCKFCKMGTEKLVMMLDRNDIGRTHVKFMIWGYDGDIANFMKESNTADCEYWFIPPMTSLDITFGKFPIYVWSDDETIVNSGDLRNLEEKRLTEFLK